MLLARIGVDCPNNIHVLFSYNDGNEVDLGVPKVGKIYCLNCRYNMKTDVEKNSVLCNYDQSSEIRNINIDETFTR